MSTVILASNENDGRALAAIEAHHAQLTGSLDLHVQTLLRAIRDRHETRVETARAELVDWCRRELEPHAEAEEATLYPAARQQPGTQLLVRAMSHEHGLLRHLVTRLAGRDDATTLAANAGALNILFGAHVTKENELLLPTIAADLHVSLADLLAQMHAVLEPAIASSGTREDPPRSEDGHGAHICGCDDEDPAGAPELDARAIPHAIRHATIFGALDAVAPAGAMVLIAPHDPVPLLAQIEQRTPEAFDVDYLESGPDVWRLRFTRRSG